MTGPTRTGTLRELRRPVEGEPAARRIGRQPRGALAELLRRPRYEVLPLDGVGEAVPAVVARDVKVTVTASPARGLEPTLALAETLAGAGYAVAPHLSARLVTDERELTEILDRLRGAGVRDVFVVAGDAPEPAGRFDGALDLLRAMDALGHPFHDVGITGYPESHPVIGDDLTIQAMWDKHRYATYVVSQVCFDPRLIAVWLARVRARGIALPVHVGVPGVADRTRLLRISARIGVGESTRFLRRHTGWFWRLFVPGAYDPDRLLTRTVRALAETGQQLAGVHLYTFNELAATEAWRHALLGRLDGNGRAGGRRSAS